MAYIFCKDTLVVPLNGIDTGNLFDGASSALDYFEVPCSGAGKKNLVSSYMISEEDALRLEKNGTAKLVRVRELITKMQNGIVFENLSCEELPYIIRAVHIMQWRASSVYCGSCGAKNIDSSTELCRLCPVCGRHEYPRITPAIIVAITNSSDEILLAHNREFPQGLFSLIAGFNEAGETLEDTVMREVREEVGITVCDIRYAASQPWPFPASLMIGWTARYKNGCITCDGIEIEEARWFSRSTLPELPGLGSIARYLINDWLNHPKLS